MRNTTLYGVILILIILGITSSSFADIMDGASIYNTGRIIAEVMAKSGYWRDIQDAVDLAASLGIGIVRIPEGTWNFVNVGESWTGARVTIPAGISLFGAPTERYPNGSVVEWKTVLVMPWDVPGTVSSAPIWFQIVGDSDPSKPSRFSDIKLVGYRSFDPTSTSMHIGLAIRNIIDFRVDHCRFEHTCDSAITVGGHFVRGVIDHCEFVNDYGTVGLTTDASTVKYGIAINREYYGSETSWEPDITKVIGQYTNYTVFVEDCYFTKWRHCVTGNKGAHFVVRHCIFENGFSYGEVDTHPSWLEPNVANRAAEIYENEFRGPSEVLGIGVIQWASGGGVIFNNTVASGYPRFIRFGAGNWNATYDPHDIYIWNNNVNTPVFIDGSATEGKDYFLYKPEWYTPYPYPHPLTSS